MESFTDYCEEFDALFQHDDDGYLVADNAEVDKFMDKYMMILVLVQHDDTHSMSFKISDINFVKQHGTCNDKYSMCLDIRDKIKQVRKIINT